MQFRRNDERRRRVFRDETRGGAADESTSAAGSAPQNRRPYSDEVERQPLLTDLIPLRPVRVLLSACVGICLLLGLIVLDDRMSHAAPAHDDPFRLEAPGSLNRWLSSALLAWGSLGAAVTFLIRRHRNDDYRGCYYIWLWAAAALMLGSVCATAPLHRWINLSLVKATGISLGEHGWWLSTGGVLGASLAIRIGWETRNSRLASTWLWLAVAGYGAAATLVLDVVAAPEVLTTFATQLALLTGHLAVAQAVWCYARHVLLEARGLKAASLKRDRGAQQTQRREKAAAKAAEKAAAKAAKAAGKEARPAGKGTRKASRKTAAAAATRDSEPQSGDAAPPEPSERRATKGGGGLLQRRKPRSGESEAADDSQSAPEDGVATIGLEAERQRLQKADKRRQRKQRRAA